MIGFGENMTDDLRGNVVDHGNIHLLFKPDASPSWDDMRKPSSCYRLAIMVPGALYRWRVRIEVDGVEMVGYGNTPDEAEDNALAMQDAQLCPKWPDHNDHRQMRWQNALLTQRRLYAADTA